ncbi:BrnA antitoxin family protein [Marinibaculum pumilum]|uniref:BrnA antitoxin family protein n=1 Tax=Marinibaculum pumilum TaxID=1766165 RepID=A0ABV7KYM7_9PROT
MADKRSLSRRQAAELAALDRLSDEDIATDDPDAPETVDWSGAVRGRFYRPVKKQTTIRIDADILEWFRLHRREGDRGYQSHINAALREYVARMQSSRR